MQKSNVYLVGLMGSGKTSIGKILAKRMGMKFIDLDAEIIKDQQCSISEIFDRFGEEEFRHLENKKLLSTLDIDNCVISTGGGIIMDQDNIKIMVENGSIIHLDIDLETQLLRIKNKKNRPLLKDKDDERNILVKMRKERDHIYKKISVASVNTSNKKRNDIVSEVVNIIQ
tara:strand:+ start:10 stop:522 length:513 start_codon:yes stop_codon:yes gene_type:complete